MKIDLDGIVIIVGNYGRVKSEVSINLAVNRKRAGLEVRIADLDLVNPFGKILAHTAIEQGFEVA